MSVSVSTKDYGGREPVHGREPPSFHGVVRLYGFPGGSLPFVLCDPVNEGRDRCGNTGSPYGEWGWGGPGTTVDPNVSGGSRVSDPGTGDGVEGPIPYDKERGRERNENTRTEIVCG